MINQSLLQRAVDFPFFEEKTAKEFRNNVDIEGILSKTTNIKINVVDFFSGCGGLSYGFHALGKQFGCFNVCGSFDNDKHANATYARNLDLIPSNIDLADASINEILEIMVKNGYDKKLPLIVIGGPPCQGFSSHRKKDKEKASEDSRNTLVGKYAEIAVGLNADLVVLENVPDLLGEKDWKHFEIFNNILTNAGYTLTAKITNMAEFGVPQERFRTIVIAAKKFIPSQPSPRFKRPEFRTVRDAIGDLPPLASGEISKNDPMHITSKHRAETIKLLQKVPKNGGSRPHGIGPACLDRVNGFYDVYGRLFWDRPSVTITARCRTPSTGRFAHPEQDRGLSVREAGLLQSFPSKYYFEGPFDDKFKQIGNAVPPLYSMYLATHLLSMMIGNDRGSLDTIENITQPSFKSFGIFIAHIKQSNGNGYSNGTKKSN